MTAKVAKILGDNLDSNSSMVLFADKTITLEADSETAFVGAVELQLFDTSMEADLAFEELLQYLDKCSKSRGVFFNPLVDASALGISNPIRVPSIYAAYGGCVDVLSVDSANILDSRYYLSVATSSVDDTKYCIQLNTDTTVKGSLG